jgi:hypothetical protein
MYPAAFSVALFHGKLVRNGSKKWHKSAQNAPGNLPLNSSESKSYSGFWNKTPPTPPFSLGSVQFRRRISIFRQRNHLDFQANSATN